MKILCNKELVNHFVLYPGWDTHAIVVILNLISIAKIWIWILIKNHISYFLDILNIMGKAQYIFRKKRTNRIIYIIMKKYLYVDCQILLLITLGWPWPQITLIYIFLICWPWISKKKKYFLFYIFFNLTFSAFKWHQEKKT